MQQWITLNETVQVGSPRDLRSQKVKVDTSMIAVINWCTAITIWVWCSLRFHLIILTQFKLLGKISTLAMVEVTSCSRMQHSWSKIRIREVLQRTSTLEDGRRIKHLRGSFKVKVELVRTLTSSISLLIYMEHQNLLSSSIEVKSVT